MSRLESVRVTAEASVCFAESVDEAFAGARVSAVEDFAPSARERNAAAE
jgi:hypothetical protein